MSIFSQRIDYLKKNYRLSFTDYLKLIAHYPLFKMAWHANYGTNWKKKIAAKITPFYSKYSINILAHGKKNFSTPIPITFESSDLSSFEEIFFGNEYESPIDLNQCKTYVDLGANTGMASLFFLLKHNLEQLIIVEANPLLIPILKKNLSFASRSNIKIFIENAYISGTSSESIEFFAANDHRLSTEAKLISNKDGKIFSIQKMPLQKLLNKQNLNEVDILKMDIEGGEYGLIDEDPEVFKRFKNIFAEVHGKLNIREDFILKLKNLGFKIVNRKKAETDCETIFACRTT